MKRIYTIALIGFSSLCLMPNMLLGAPAEKSEIRQQLEIEIKAGLPAEVSVEKRVSLLKNFVKDLKLLDDLDLGEVAENAAEISSEEQVEKREEFETLKAEITAFISAYESEIKPILLRNWQMKRIDAAAMQNTGDLIQLFFSSKHNHQTGKPISGIARYQQDVGGFFSSEKVDAGLLINFPGLEQEAWFQAALQMEKELLELKIMHREYQDESDGKKKVEKAVEIVSSLQVDVPKAPVAPVPSPAAVQTQPDTILKDGTVSDHDRVLFVRRFARAIKDLDPKEDFTKFKHDLLAILKAYETQVKSILVNNINLSRRDAAAKTNHGDLIMVLLPNINNHRTTGQPITSKLRYKENVSTSFFGEEIKEVGLLVDRPELEQEAFIQSTIAMEKELVILLSEHDVYMRGGKTSAFEDVLM